MKEALGFIFRKRLVAMLSHVLLKVKFHIFEYKIELLL